ncbi:PREDICTED: ADP-glucose phosphorylase [Tarenaya hassleriana]|uniref:ADP-glucose phosphorylase n=1 Tax=Tarenaya hassleriana TaxID=28532 RepID=UPI00053C48D7|nr:PREDICTED: ADP-glucose phosphorylase [Tarenaya hassleriana]
MSSPNRDPDHGGDSAGTRSPEIRKDPVTNRWVVFSPARAKRPTDFKSKSPQNPNPKSSSCPFCIGREDDCAPEIFRVPDVPDWKIRVIENLYPALNRDLEIQTGQLKTGRVLPGFGFHDVVVEAPVHSIQLSDMDPEDIGGVLLAYTKRIEQIKQHDSVKYIQVFKNHGASAGASMSHSHSQILALPVVPPTVSSRLDGTKEYFDQTGWCCLCEAKPKELVINESCHFVSFVPFAAAFPFEIWIVPKYHSSHFHDLDTNKAVDLGRLLKLMLQKMAKQLNKPPFNYMIHTSPLEVAESQLLYTHWFLQIVPQLSGVGGFEIGTGCYINPVFPEDVAKVLREVSLP